LFEKKIEERVALNKKPVVKKNLSDLIQQIKKFALIQFFFIKK